PSRRTHTRSAGVGAQTLDQARSSRPTRLRSAMTSIVDPETGLRRYRTKARLKLLTEHEYAFGESAEMQNALYRRIFGVTEVPTVKSNPVPSVRTMPTPPSPLIDVYQSCSAAQSFGKVAFGLDFAHHLVTT